MVKEIYRGRERDTNQGSNRGKINVCPTNVTFLSKDVQSVKEREKKEYRRMKRQRRDALKRASARAFEAPDLRERERQRKKERERETRG